MRSAVYQDRQYMRTCHCVISRILRLVLRAQSDGAVEMQGERALQRVLHESVQTSWKGSWGLQLFMYSLLLTRGSAVVAEQMASGVMEASHCLVDDSGCVTICMSYLYCHRGAYP